MNRRTSWVVGLVGLAVILGAGSSSGVSPKGSERGRGLPAWVQEFKSQPKLAAAKEPVEVKPTVFDCSKTGLQEVIDAAKSRDIIELDGICHESVNIEEKRLTLRGVPVTPETPGPNGIQSPGPFPSIAINHSPAVTLQDLQISGGAATGVVAVRSRVLLTDCEIDGNTGSGVVATDATNLTGVRLQINGNTGQGFQAVRAATAFCDECDINGNGGWQGNSTFQSLVSIRDSVVTGTRGLLASVNSYIDLDCASIATTHACSLAATDYASLADSQAVMTYYGSGDFSGSFQAFNGASTHLWGARQQALGTRPNLSPRENYLDVGSLFDAAPWYDEDENEQQSRLLGVTISGFTTATFFGATAIGGNVNCDSGGDAWADGATVLEPGAAFNGCEHYVAP